MNNFITVSEAIAIHDNQVERYGGSFGIRDEGLLESAMAQPQATFFGELLHPTLFLQAAAYLFHLSRNHPFIDGNKRTALAVMDTFLRINGCRLSLSDEELEELTLRTATGELEKEAIAQIIEQHLNES